MSDETINEHTNNSEYAEKPANGGMRTRKKAALVLSVMIFAASVLGATWWIRSKTHVTTDDAFIDAHIHQVSPRVPGHVTEVLVEDNQYVKKGELLVVLDPTDYEVQVRKAASDLDAARNEKSQDYARLDSARAREELAAAKLELAGNNLRRGRELFERGVISGQDLDRLETDEKVAKSDLQDAKEAVRSAQAQLGLDTSGGRDAKVKEKTAVLRQAELALTYTKIYSPSDGYITRKSVEPGNNIQAGQPLMAVVNLDDAWVVANYKESQLQFVGPGQPVEFEVDAYPGKVFRGRVDSIMAGTGAAFSLLPPENATGNFVKIVQRVPVKITVDRTSDPGHLLRVGMSVVPTIDTGRTARDVLKEVNPF